MPATGYLALESLCVEIGEAKGERGSRERKDNRQSALQGAWPCIIARGWISEVTLARCKEKKKGNVSQLKAGFSYAFLPSVGPFLPLYK